MSGVVHFVSSCWSILVHKSTSILSNCTQTAIDLREINSVMSRKTGMHPFIRVWISVVLSLNISSSLAELSQDADLDFKKFASQLIAKDTSLLRTSNASHQLGQIYIIQQHAEPASSDGLQVYLQFTAVATCTVSLDCEDEIRLCRARFNLDQAGMKDDVTQCEPLPVMVVPVRCDAGSKQIRSGDPAAEMKKEMESVLPGGSDPRGSEVQELCPHGRSGLPATEPQEDSPPKPHTRWEQIRLIADYAMIQLDKIDGDNYRRIALDVLSIREQLILDGSVVQYSLTLVSMSTACVERKSLSGVEDCLKEQVAPMETCSVDCVRPVTSGEAPRVVRSVCAPQVTFARRDIVGNPVDVATTDEEAADALSFAVGVICEGSSSTNKLGFLKLLSSSRQVVAGILFTFTLQVTRTSCEKTDSSTDCPIEGAGDESDPDFNQCVVKVWEQAWRNPRYTVTDLKCVRPNAKTTS